MPGEEAYVSLVTNDSYSQGALALGRSLRDSLTQRRLSLLITGDVSYPMRGRLSEVWDELTVVEEIDSEDAERLALLTRPELGVTFSKLHAWRLTRYSKCVFLDADTLILENVDELFDREELSAAPDIGWPDCFNSGVFVYQPSLETFSNLLAMAQHTGSFDGGDQGLLNLYWSDWATRDIKYHIPFIYNMVPNAAYGYAPAYQRFGRNAKIIHFIGPVKPWQHQYVPGVDSVVLAPGTYSSQHAAYDFIKRWWQVYNSLQQQRSALVPGVISRGTSPHPITSTTSCPNLHYDSCPPHYHLMTSLMKLTFVQPPYSPPSLSSPPPPRVTQLHVPPNSPCTRTPSPAPRSWEGCTENDDTVTDSVHLTPPLSPSPSPSLSPLPPSPSSSSPSPLPPSPPPPVTSQTHESFPEGVQGASVEAVTVEGVYYPPGKSKEQSDIEQGRIDYTGRHRSEMVIDALDRLLHSD